MGELKVSIITVSYNAQNTIEKTIKSVLAQTYKNIEYIIVDGNSQDDTLKVVKKYEKNINRFISENDKGIYDAMNKGIAVATGDIIGILNADDWYEIETVSRVVETFKSNEIVDIVTGQINFVDDDFIIGKSSYFDIENICYRMPIAHPATFVRSRIYKNIGSYNIEYKIAADYEFTYRCYLAGCRFKYLEDVLANFSLSGISSKKHDQLYKEDECILTKYNVSSKQVKEALSLKKKQLSFFTANKMDFDNILGGRKVYIWGSGYWGCLVARRFTEEGVDFEGFIDNSKERQNMYIYKHLVYSPQSLQRIDEDIIIIIAVQYAFDEIKLQIEKLNVGALYLSCNDMIERLWKKEG